MLIVTILSLSLILSVCGYDHHHRHHYRHEQEERWSDGDEDDSDDDNDNDFDYFKLTLIYPSSVCHAEDDSIEDYCKVPENAAAWTIHGLWPNRNDGTFPQFCGGKERKFNLSKLAPIEGELKKDWPNLFPKRSASSFWKHEWEKHGTCAEAVSDVNSELKYFNKSLALYDRFDIFGALKAQDIVPSKDKRYNALQIRQALQLAYGGNVEFHCLRDAKTNEWVLADVRLCLAKNFQVMDCESKRRSRPRRKAYPLPTYQPCPADGILYVPFNGAHGAGSTTTTGRKAIPLLLPLYSLWRHFHL